MKFYYNTATPMRWSTTLWLFTTWEVLVVATTVWPLRLIFTLGPITDQCWSLISKIVRRELQKKLMQFIKWVYKIGKIFYFLYYTFSGLAKDQNSPLGHDHHSCLPPINKSILKSKIIPTEWFLLVDCCTSAPMTWADRAEEGDVQRGALLNE